MANQSGTAVADTSREELPVSALEPKSVDGGAFSSTSRVSVNAGPPRDPQMSLPGHGGNPPSYPVDPATPISCDWSAVGSSGQCVGRRAWLASRLTAQASATGPRCRSLSGLITARIIWTCPSSTSSVMVLITLLSRSWKIAPGWPFTSCGCNATPIRNSRGKFEASTRATFSAPMTPRANAGALPPPSPTI